MVSTETALPKGRFGETAYGKHSPYSGRDILLFALNPAFLCTMLPWYADFLAENVLLREEYRNFGHRGKMNSDVSGFSESRLMRHFCRIPAPVMGAMIAVDADFGDPHNTKIYDFLKDFPEFDLRTGKGA